MKGVLYCACCRLGKVAWTSQQHSAVAVALLLSLPTCIMLTFCTVVGCHQQCKCSHQNAMHQAVKVCGQAVACATLQTLDYCAPQGVVYTQRSSAFLTMLTCMHLTCSTLESSPKMAVLTEIP